MINLRRLEDLLAEKGWGAGELANYSGVKYDTVYSIKVGRRLNTTSDTLKKIAAALDTTTDYLLNESEKRRAENYQPEPLRRLTHIASSLDATRQEELARIAQVLADIDAEAARDVAGIRAAMRVLDHQQGGDAVEDLAGILADELPEVGAQVNASTAHKRDVQGGQDNAARRG